MRRPRRRRKPRSTSDAKSGATARRPTRKVALNLQWVADGCLDFFASSVVDAQHGGQSSRATARTRAPFFKTAVRNLAQANG